MKFRVLINGEEAYEGPSLVGMVISMTCQNMLPGDEVQTFVAGDATPWMRVDNAVMGFALCEPA